MKGDRYYLTVTLLAAIAVGAFLANNAEDEAPSQRDSNELTICSFNIQFLGHFKKRENAALASILKPYDIVVVQELVAPPVDGVYPEGTAYSADAEARAFFQEMEKYGFAYAVSEEDTGPSDEIHNCGPATEWWAVFYDPNVVGCASDESSTFLADDRGNNPDYERVPHAFAFQTLGETFDFVLISVHLRPGASRADKARRKHELTAIAEWIDDNDDVEKDFIVLGDMNIQDFAELADSTPAGYSSLNDECRATNTNINNPRPYDHVMYDTAHTTEIDTTYDLRVFDLVTEMEPFWTYTGVAYPGDPYNHNQFRQYYSDHNPVVFKMKVPDKDDD